MNVGFFIFLNLFVKLSMDETNCENPCGSKPCELASLSNRDLAESEEHMYHVVQYSSSLFVASSITFIIEPIKLCKSTVLTILKLNWNKRFRDKKTKLNICHHMLTWVFDDKWMTVIGREIPLLKKGNFSLRTFRFIMQIISWKDIREQLPSSQLLCAPFGCKSN